MRRASDGVAIYRRATMDAMLRSISDNRVAAAQKPLSRRDFLWLGGLGLAGIVAGSTLIAKDPAAVSQAAALAKFEPEDGLVYTGACLTRPKDLCVERAVRRWNPTAVCVSIEPPVR